MSLSPHDDTRYVAVRPVPIAAALCGVLLGIVTASLLAHAAHRVSEGAGSELWQKMWPIIFGYFDVDREYNLATWFSSGLWLALGLIAAFIAVTRPRLRWSWWLFAVVALVASIDEYLQLHEHLAGVAEMFTQHLPVRIGYPWVVLGAPIAIAVALVLLRLWLTLPRPAQVCIAVGGALFLLGAIVVETINGQIHLAHDYTMSRPYFIGSIVEECLEGAGVSIALAGLLSLFQRDAQDGSFRLDRQVVLGRRDEAGPEA